AARTGDLRSPSLLDGQLGILEEPGPDENSIRVDASRPIEDVIADILRELDPRFPADQSVVTPRAEQPSIRPDLQWSDPSISAAPDRAAQGFRRTDSPLAIEDYAIAGRPPSLAATAPSTGYACRASTATPVSPLC